MTLKEKVAMEEPEKVSTGNIGGVHSCPHNYEYLPKNMDLCPPGIKFNNANEEKCTRCWNQEMPETEAKDKEEEVNDMVTAEKIDFEVAYEDLKVEHEKLMKDYEDLNKTVTHQQSHMRRMQDEIIFLRSCVMRAVGGNKNDT